MANVTVSFLISINLSEFLPKVKSKAKKEKRVKNGKKSSNKDTKSSKSKKKKAKESTKKKKDTPVKEESPCVIEVGPPVGYLNMEYVLLPNTEKRIADIIYWRKAAKIFANDEERAVLTIEKDDKIWIPFCVKYFFNVDNGAINTLHDHLITVTMVKNKAKVGPIAKSDKTKKLYIRESDVGKKFAEAFNTDPNEDYIRTPHPSLIILKKLNNIVDGEEGYNLISYFLLIPGLIHRNRMLEVMDKKEIDFKSYAPVCGGWEEDIEEILEAPRIRKKANKGKKKGKKGKKGEKKEKKSSTKSTKSSKKSKSSSKGSKSSKKSKKKGKPKKFDVVNMLISGEIFFTEQSPAIFDIQISPDCTDPETEYPIKYYAFVTARNILEKEQIQYKNPLVIKIKKLHNLPIDILREHKISHVYAQYKIPTLTQCTTQLKPVSQLVKFNEEHAHFTDECQKKLFIEYLQSQRFTVEIKGKKTNWTPNKIPHLYGEEVEDAQISDIIRTTKHQIKGDPEDDKDVTLAVACFDLSLLLKPRYMVMHEITNTCQNPDTFLFRKFKQKPHREILSGKNFKLNVFSYPKISPLTEEILLQYGTSLEIHVLLSAPLPTLEIYSSQISFSRMFLIIRDQTIAYELINYINAQNCAELDNKTFRTHYLKAYNKSMSVLLEHSRESISDKNVERGKFFRVITGFVLDSGNWIAMFIEGINFGLMNAVWDKIMNFNEPALTIHFNSDLIFEDRLYTEFVDFGGIFHITLHKNLEETFANEKIYLTGNVPNPCWDGLKKINLLLKSKSMRIICQCKLLPTPEELFAINIELGVPMHLQFTLEATEATPSANEEVDAEEDEEDTISNDIDDNIYTIYTIPDEDNRRLSVISCC